MEEQKTYAVKLDGIFPEEDGPVVAHGTAGEILEQIADKMGLEDQKEDDDLGVALDGVYPSTRAIAAHHLLEERIGSSGAYGDPDLLIAALIREDQIAYLTDDEYDEWIDEEEMYEYDEARGELGEEWNDGRWET